MKLKSKLEPVTGPFRPYRDTKILVKAIKASCAGKKSLKERYPQIKIALLKTKTALSKGVTKSVTVDGATLPGGKWKSADGTPGLPSWHMYFAINGLRQHHHRKLLRIIGTLLVPPKSLRDEDIATITSLHMSTIAKLRRELRHLHGSDKFPRRRRNYELEIVKRSFSALGSPTRSRWLIIAKQREKGWTLQQIADVEDCSRQRIYQILQRMAFLQENEESMAEEMKKVVAKVIASA